NKRSNRKSLGFLVSILRFSVGSDNSGSNGSAELEADSGIAVRHPPITFARLSIEQTSGPASTACDGSTRANRHTTHRNRRSYPRHQIVSCGMPCPAWISETHCCLPGRELQIAITRLSFHNSFIIDDGILHTGIALGRHRPVDRRQDNGW